MEGDESMTNYDTLASVAKELKNHAWLERFRKASEDNTYAEISPFSARFIAKEVDKLIDLIELAAMNGEQLTIEDYERIGT